MFVNSATYKKIIDNQVLSDSDKDAIKRRLIAQDVADEETILEMSLQELEANFSSEYMAAVVALKQTDSDILFENNSRENTDDMISHSDDLQDISNYIEDAQSEYDDSIDDYAEDPIIGLNLSVEDILRYEDAKELLEAAYLDEDIIKIVNEDDDKELSDEEKEKFESYIKGDDQNIDLEKLKEVLQLIKDNEFDIDKYSDYKMDNAQEAKEVGKTEKNKTKNTNNSTSGGSYGGGSDNQLSLNPLEENYSNMSEEKLLAAKSEKEALLNDEKIKLSQIADGLSEELKEKEAFMDNALTDYQNEVALKDSALAKRLVDAENDYKAQEKAVSNAQAQLTQQKLAVQDAQISLENAQNRRDIALSCLEQNKAMLSSIEAPSSGATSEEKAEYNEQIAAINAKIQEAQKAYDDAVEACTEADTKLKAEQTAQQEAEQKLSEQKELLASSQQEIDNVEAEISKLDDSEGTIANAKNQYDLAKKMYYSKKQELISNTNTNIDKYKAELNEINAEISTRENNKLADSITYSQKGKWFDQDAPMKMINLDDGVVLRAPQNYTGNEEIPLLVYFAGAGSLSADQFYLNAEKMGYSGLTLYIDQDHYLNCGYVTKTIKNLQQAYNIDAQNINAMGFSAGCQGSTNYIVNCLNSNNGIGFNNLLLADGLSGWELTPANLNAMQQRGISIKTLTPYKGGTRDFRSQEFLNVVPDYTMITAADGSDVSHGSVPAQIIAQEDRYHFIQWLTGQ